MDGWSFSPKQQTESGLGSKLKQQLNELTVLSHVQLVDGVDVAQVGDTSLDLGASLSCRLINAFDHLLLFVDPVQVVPKNCQTDRLQDVGVCNHDPIGSCNCFFKAKQNRNKNKENFRNEGNKMGEELRGEAGGVDSDTQRSATRQHSST